MSMRGGRWLTSVLTVLLIGLTLSGCVVGDSDEETATERDGPLPVTPDALDEAPEGVGEATITITGGELVEELLTLQEDEPTILHVVNGDETAYRLWIGEDLVITTTIPAAVTTDVEFTTPNAAVYEGRLLAADDDTVLDTMVVRVQSPGAVEP